MFEAVSENKMEETQIFTAVTEEEPQQKPPFELVTDENPDDSEELDIAIEGNPEGDPGAPMEEELVLEATQLFDAVTEEPAAEEPAEETAEETPAEPEKKPKKRRRRREINNNKRRPAMKKNYGLFGLPHVAATFIWLMLIVVIGVSFGRLLWVCCADLMAFGKPNKEITITITAEEIKTMPDGTKKVNMDSISKKMGDAGLIRYPVLFKFFAEITKKDQDLQPGTYTLNAFFDYNAMINAMSYHEKPREIVTVLIPEGYNCAQIFALMEESNVCTVAELEEYTISCREVLPEYWFLSDEMPWGEKYCLEGYLFPDTYEFYVDDDPSNVINKMLANFDSRFTDKMKSDLEAIEQKYGMSLHEVITIASMVEKEAVGATKTSGSYEGYAIAAVYYNRLAKWEHPLLGCDATVYYAMGDYFGQSGELTQEHLATDSPYNTRKYAGLPPGPIANPGSYSIYAALTPDEQVLDDGQEDGTAMPDGRIKTIYYYYVYDPEQERHVFTKTLEEHDKLSEELGY